MIDIDLDLLGDLEYFNYMGVRYNEKYTFYYDETNNCRKFWIREADNSFNTDYDADFVLAGVCFDGIVPTVRLEDLIEVLNLQKNTKEIKFSKHFSKKNFLDCMGEKRTRDFFRWLDAQDLYIHYFNINNLYYAIVELFDSITDPRELTELDFDYFGMKSILYETLRQNPGQLQKIMAEYRFPNISQDRITSFCDKMISMFPIVYNCSTEQKYLIACLKRAKEKGELVFLEKNIDFVMQENYFEFYIDPICTYGESMHYFDEELSIQNVFGDYSLKRNGKEVTNFSFVNSLSEVWIQVSDVVAGIFGKLFCFVNQKGKREMIKEIAGYSEIQLESVYLLNKLRNEANSKDKGLLHSITATDVLLKLDDYLAEVSRAYEAIS